MDVRIKLIWQKTYGLPVLLEPWINHSENLDPVEIDINKFCCSIISQYSDIDPTIITKINKLSLLKYPFPMDILIKYLNLKDHNEYDIFLVDAVRYGIFDKSAGWFRNELIQKCFREEIADFQRIRLHKEVAQYYETIIENNSLTKNEKLTNFIEYSYHLHNGELHDKSLSANLKLAQEMIDLSNLSIAEECLNRSIIDSEKLNALIDKCFSQA